MVRSVYVLAWCSDELILITSQLGTKMLIVEGDIAKNNSPLANCALHRILDL